MSFWTTAEDCDHLIAHFLDAKRRFHNKARRKSTPLAMKSCYNGRVQWLDQRIKYYKEKKKRL